MGQRPDTHVANLGLSPRVVVMGGEAASALDWGAASFLRLSPAQPHPHLRLSAECQGALRILSPVPSKAWWGPSGLACPRDLAALWGIENETPEICTSLDCPMPNTASSHLGARRRLPFYFLFE